MMPSSQRPMPLCLPNDNQNDSSLCIIADREKYEMKGPQRGSGQGIIKKRFMYH
jgi:hypothetical protein